MTSPLVRTPLLLEPIAVPRVWGGERILRELHPELDAEAPIGESWEVSDVGEDGTYHSVVAGTGAERVTLRELLVASPTEVLGSAIYQPGTAPRLPLLYKFIDARDVLSVQIHPDDALAAELGGEGRGKTEAWIILDAEPGAHIVYGLEEGLGYTEYLDQAKAGRGDEGLHRVPVARGDIVYLPAGTLHAIGSGILLAEIQQSSDITYRIHDWNRMGLDGKPRQLHLDEAARVTPIEPPPCPLPLPDGVEAGEDHASMRIDGEFFTLLEIRSSGAGHTPESSSDRFAIFSCLEGQAELSHGGKTFEVPECGVVFVPAAARAEEIELRGSFWGLWMEPKEGV